jgi:hypothetical protein
MAELHKLLRGGCLKWVKIGHQKWLIFYVAAPALGDVRRDPARLIAREQRELGESALCNSALTH